MLTQLSLWMRYMRGQCCSGGFTTLSLWMRYMRGQCCWRGFTTQCHCRWETWEVSAAEVASLHCHCGWDTWEDSAAEVASLHSVIVDERSVSLWMRYMRGQCCWGDFTTQCHCGWDTWEVCAAEVASLQCHCGWKVSAAEVTSLHSVIVDERSVLLRWLHYTVSLWMRYMRGQCCWGGFTTQCHCRWDTWKVSAAEVASPHCHCGWDTWEVSAAEVTSLHTVIADEIHERSVLLRWLHYTVSLWMRGQCHCGWDTWAVSAAEVASLHSVIMDEIHERSVLLRWLHYTVSLWMRYMRGLCCWGGFTTQCHCGWKVSAAEVTSLHSVIVDERSVLLRWLHYAVSL